MKRSISMLLIAIITLAALAILCTATAVAEEEPMTELVSFYEINGKMPEIFLRHTDDRKSSCERGTTNYTERTANRQNKLTANERYSCEPWVVTVRYPETTRQATILYRNPETRLESLAEGFIKIRRWLKGHERVDDEIEANYVFQARLDEEGRRFDYVDYVCEIDGNTMSIVHTFDEKEQIHFYRVLGDARKAEPKKTKKSSTPKQEEKTETTDWTIQPVETDDEENPPEGTDWTIDGDNDDDNPPTTDEDTEESTHWTITGQEPEQDPEPETEKKWTIGDTSDVSLIEDDFDQFNGASSSQEESWSIGGGNPPSEPAPTEEGTGWTI